MRVGLSDPEGPKGWRLLPYALPAALMLLAVFGPIYGTAATLTVVAAFGFFNAAGLVPLRQRRPRAAELECGPGYITLSGAGSRNQRILAKDIVGATTARTSGGLLLTLQHRKRTQPITLELANDAEGERVRHALGIGHGGFGVIAWRTYGESTQRVALGGRAIAAASALCLILLSAGAPRDVAFGFGALVVMVGFVGAMLGLTGLLSSPTEPTVIMGADGLRLKTVRGWFALPYDAVHRVGELPRALAFSVPPPYHDVVVPHGGPATGGVSASEREILVSQVRAAAARARGFGPRKNDVTGRVDVLRRNGESPRDWLVRLDMAGQMLSIGPGYRGNTLDTEDLWAILEDPEAEPDLRAAAARVLRHSPQPEARVRIDAAVAAVRDESTSRRIRIAVRDDVDGASHDLALLDATSPLREARMRAPGHDRSAQGR